MVCLSKPLMPHYEAICGSGVIGSRPGLKIQCPEMGVRVRIPSPAPVVGTQPEQRQQSLMCAFYGRLLKLVEEDALLTRQAGETVRWFESIISRQLSRQQRH